MTNLTIHYFHSREKRNVVGDAKKERKRKKETERKKEERESSMCLLFFT